MSELASTGLIGPTHQCWLRLPLAAFALLLAAGHAIGAADSSEPSFHQRIDELVDAGFSKWEVSAAEMAPDAERLRRIYLDLTGRIPDAGTAQRFIDDRSGEKWSRLVDELLAGEAYANHMAVVFDIMLMERRPDKWVTSDEWRQYLAKSFASDKPLDQLVAEILGADGVDAELRPAAKYYLDRLVDKDALVRDTGRLFLGMDLQCAQCHDHPTIDDYLHEHYFGLSVFFAGSKTYKMPDGKMALQETVMREVEFASVFQPDQTNKTGPQLPYGPALNVPEFEKGEEYVEPLKGKVRAVPKFSLRQLLAQELPTERTPAFARNMANRLWAMMMGRGIVHPLDMHYAENPPSHPELLDLLTDQLIASDYDTRSLLRELALSRTYQRSSIAPESFTPDDIPPQSFALANMKGLSAEQLFESLLQATGGESIFAQQIEETLREGDGDYGELAADEDKLAQARTAARKAVFAKVITLTGSLAGTAQDRYQPSLPESLYLANNEIVTGWLEPRLGSLAEQLLIRDEPRLVAEMAWINILSRMPLEDEVLRVEVHFRNRGAERPAAVSELIWSLLASAEFRLNH